MMATAARRVALFLIAIASALTLACNTPAHALDAKSQATLDELDKFFKEDRFNRRNLCASGKATNWVATKRAQYADKERFPDASQMCVAVLTSIAADGNLGDLYRELLTKLRGDVTDYEEWPRSIGGTVMGDKTEVAIGNKKVVDVTSALAFDAGFTVAYQDGNAAKTPNADADQLKALAESCLKLESKPGPCFAAGYVYGARAYKARTASTR